ncbi:A G-specific DNA glycosylase [Staphylococcus gallinarum]|uniref:A G-specific DNA glycosylase n=1 Tax=Staphylococcus gallinarum TaxID=1293 RepID=A0A380FL74_STAGA|nr:A G-specific DNA glycosylase [Staphylococcus gallinarum]
MRLESNESIQQTLGQEISFNEKPVYTLKHQFTHITWDISVFVAESNDNEKFTCIT